MMRHFLKLSYVTAHGTYCGFAHAPFVVNHIIYDCEEFVLYTDVEVKCYNNLVLANILFITQLPSLRNTSRIEKVWWVRVSGWVSPGHQRLR